MPVISYKDLSKYLKKRGSEPFLPVFLIYGEDLLVQGVFDELLDALLPASQRSINYDPLDGLQANVHEVVERVNTFSLLPGTKVIALRGSRIFYARQDKERLLGSTRQETGATRTAATTCRMLRISRSGRAASAVVNESLSGSACSIARRSFPTPPSSRPGRSN